MKALIKNTTTGYTFFVYAEVNKWDQPQWVTQSGRVIGHVGVPLIDHKVLKIYYRRPKWQKNKKKS